jgi:hypothetical protein
MTKIALALATGTLLGAFGLTAASASPLMPATAPIVAGDQGVDQVAYRHHRGMRHHHGMRHHRRMPMSRMRSDPNSRNPSQPGYMQQKGTTSGGPRY